MKIQFLSESFVFYDLNIKGELFGGQEILLNETCISLLKAGHDVSVVQFGTSNKKFLFNNIPVTQIKVPKLLFLQRIGFIRRWTWSGFYFIKAIDKKADWIHLHNHHFSFPLVFFKTKGQIMTGMNHGVEWDVPWTYESLSLKNVRDRFTFFLLRAVSNFSINKLDKMISNDRFFIHFATLFRPNLAKKFQYIPNFFDPSFVSNQIIESELMSEIENFLDGKKLVYLPKMSMRERGTDLLIKASMKQDDWKLVISGISSQQKEFIDLKERMGLSKKVFFTGHITRAEQSSIYIKSDIVVIPSPCREATAIALLEAMAFRKPVIASEIGGLVEIIWNNHNGILCQPTKDDFARNIKYLLKNPQVARSLAHNAFEDVHKRFNKEIWVNSMLNFFSK